MGRFFYAKNHDFCTTWGNINHLLKQGIFSLDICNTDKCKFDQRFEGTQKSMKIKLSLYLTPCHKQERVPESG